MKTRALDFSQELQEMLCDIFCASGFSTEDARTKSKAAWRQISERFAGNKFYMPRDKSKNGERDEAIYAAHKFGKISVREIAKHYGISHSRAWRIVERVEGELGTKNNVGKGVDK
jgi:Mor family transcriptional regulator